MKRFFECAIAASLLVLAGTWPALSAENIAATGPVTASETVPDGVIFRVGDTYLKLEVWSDNIVRVISATNRSFFSHSTPATEVRVREQTRWKVSTGKTGAVLSTARLRVHVDSATGAVSFCDSQDRPIVAEKPDSRTLTPADVQGEQTFHVAQQWLASPDESLYGLGQLQFGIVDIKGYDLDLWQHNTCVVVPLLVSSRGYGIFWDNLSYSRFGDLRPFESIPADCLRDNAGQSGGLTTGTVPATSSDKLEGSRTTSDLVIASRGRAGGWTRFIGQVVPPSTGDYKFRIYSNGGIKLWLDGKLVVDRWRQNWLTENDQVKIHLEAGRPCAIRLESGGDQRSTMQLRWKTPAPDPATTLWSEVGDGIDYYFIYGPALDKVIAGARRLTGTASMMPQWAFGLWQSRQRYETAQQSLDVVDEYRRRGIPFDNIVQDWQYWPRDAWGSHQFDSERFPDPEGWLKALHEKHAHVMISVWGKFYSGTANFDALQKAGFLYQQNLKENIHDWINFPYTFYDAFNPAARAAFWSQINTALFSKGIDAWWMDATEPDLTPSPPTLEGQRTHMTPTAMGPASRVMNGYALMNSMGVYQGQRQAAPDQRVFILTRSGFAGTQRFATATWSGDTTSTWQAMEKQIAAGLGFSVSGVPYWTMDIGGYTMENRFSAPEQTPEDADEWRELNARWFEFGTFCPLTRLHGELKPREPWTFGGDSHPAYQAIVKFDRLRYRMLPYIYSLAGAVNGHGGTIMRPLVMDFPQDTTARELANEYMFGPAFLVAPVTAYKARQREVYLPQASGWYDFWTGAAADGGKTVNAPAPYDAMPLFVRAGSIIPFGPELQYTGEKPADPITLYVYTGSDGTFELYEDDGRTYGYERALYTIIPLHWDDARKTLTIGKRSNGFPGYLASRTFNVVLVSKDKPAAYSSTPTLDRTVSYEGKPIKVQFK